MTTYNTYQEAKIANPDKEILTDCKKVEFTAELGLNYYHKCNPADYCMTNNEFLSNGNSIVTGDIVLDDKRVVIVNSNNDLETYNSTVEGNDITYILRAAALEENDPELTKDDSPQGILSAISNRLHNVGCEHQNLAFGHELSGMACDIWGVLPLISNESIQDKKPRTKVEYVKCEFDSAWEAVKDFEDGKKLYTKRSHKDYILIDNAPDVLRFLYDLHKRIETETDEREVFIEALNDLFQSHTMSTSDLFNAIVDSGKFKLVN